MHVVDVIASNLSARVPPVMGSIELFVPSYCVLESACCSCDNKRCLLQSDAYVA
jgi:hypothetical protein